MSKPLPIVPRPPLAPQRRSLEHAAFCEFLARGERANQRGAAGILGALYPDDRAAMAIVTRAATTGATTGTAGWASELVGVAVGEFVSALPESAAAQLIARGMRVSLAPGTGSVQIPNRTAGPTAAPWVAEGAEIPARQWILSGVPLAPKKIGLLLAFTQELANHSHAESIFRQMLAEEASFSLDAAYFSTAAATSAGLAGLLNGVTPTTLSGTASGVPGDIVRDLGALAAACNSGPGASGEVIFVVSPAMAAQLSATVSYLNIPNQAVLIASAAVPDNRIIAVDPKSIAHAFGDAVVESSKHATIHMADTPLPIASGAQGSGVLATPTMSLFQNAMISLRMLIDVAFVKRRSGCVAYADGRDWSP